MKAEELMVGDWVQIQYRNKVVRVTGIHDGLIDTSSVSPLHEDEVIPIPLTPEILEKNFPRKDSEADYVKERMDTGFSVNWFSLSDLDGVWICLINLIWLELSTSIKAHSNMCTNSSTCFGYAELIKKLSYEKTNSKN